jgi:hypothetical protein
MMVWLYLAGCTIILAFAIVVFVGPPYLPTFRKQIGTAFDLLALQPGQTVLELGSGDGRVLRAAAERGLCGVGIELNPILVCVSYIVTWKYRRQIKIIWGSYWGKPWPRADGIFTFMLPRYMQRLDTRVAQWHAGPIRLVSFAFPIPDKPVHAERDNVFMYEYK